MSIATIVLFALAASLGAFLISYILRNKNTPKGLAIIHGFIAGLAIILLIIIMFTHPGFYPALIAFVLAAIAGFTMIYRDITGKSLPKWLALSHAIVAIAGFLLLLILYVL